MQITPFFFSIEKLEPIVRIELTLQRYKGRVLPLSLNGLKLASLRGIEPAIWSLKGFRIIHYSIGTLKCYQTFRVTYLLYLSVIQAIEVFLILVHPRLGICLINWSRPSESNRVLKFFRLAQYDRTCPNGIKVP